MRVEAYSNSPGRRYFSGVVLTVTGRPFIVNPVAVKLPPGAFDPTMNSSVDSTIVRGGPAQTPLPPPDYRGNSGVSRLGAGGSPPF